MATILIVDDRATNREFLVTLLGYGGHRLLEARDGAEALALARKEHPHLVITDILMPTMDGYEFVRQLRADQAIAQTRVIFYTAHYHQQEAEALARACGVSEVLSRPSEPQVILRAVEAALGLAPSDAPAPPAEELDREHARLLTDKLSQNVNALRTANARLSALIDLSLQLGSELDLRRLLKSFCDAARDIIGARYAIVGVLDGQGGRLQHLFTSGMHAEVAARLGSPDPGAGIVRTILREKRCVCLHNPSGDPVAVGLSSAYPPVHAWLGAPIVSPTHAYGWLGLIDKVGGDGFTNEDERLARILGAQVGRIYQNGNLYADVLRQASELQLEMGERKRAEEAVRHSEAQKAAILHGSLDAIIIMDHKGKIRGWNPAAERVFGYAESEALGRPLVDLIIPPALRQQHLQGLAHYLATGQGPILDRRLELPAIRADGGEFPAELTVTRMLVEGPPMFSGYLRDMSERKKLEDQLRQAQKMEAVGKLAGGVAHDFNNLLTIITGYSEVAQVSLAPGDPLREMIDEIKKAGERAASLTRQLLAFSRKQVLVPVVFDLNALLTDMQKMLPRLIGEDIDILFTPAPALWQVKADPGQMEQIIMNLVVNARDAMPQGGKLTIETANIELDETHPTAPAGQYVMLAVTDTGCGMDQETESRIFEPFFTTKGPEKGTGLGLATVWGIVKQSGGHIEVYTELGLGTTFKVYLPRSGEKAKAGLPHPTGISKPLHGTETILLVEDEEGVRAVAAIVLQSYGYTLLAAKSGTEALVTAQRHDGPIHLMVTDVVMPNMSGRQLAERLAVLRPDMKVLYLSGYTDDAIVRHGIVDAKTPFLQKPFSPLAFARKVRDVLDQR